MHETMRPSGLPKVAPLNWGTHICLFYQETDDLLDALTGFWKAGLEAGERCLWVTPTTVRAEDARGALRRAVPDLAAREARGDIAVLDGAAWYGANTGFDAETTLMGWVRAEEQALADGYAGLRLTGDTAWLERRDWHAFNDYEAKVSTIFRTRRIVGLCSYCMRRCDASDVLDVVGTHDFALARRNRRWEAVESGSAAQTRRELEALNAELESRVESRTAELNRALAEKEVLFREVHHRVRNNLQVISSLLNLRGRQIADPKLREVLEEAAARVHSIAIVHGTLYAQADDATAVPMNLYLQTLLDSLLQTASARGRYTTTLNAAATGLPLGEATTVGLIVTEAVQNALRHGYGHSGEGTVRVTWSAEGSDCVLAVEDDGRGIPAEVVAGQGRASGLRIVDALSQKLGGSVTIRRRAEGGTRFELCFPHPATERERVAA